MSQHISHSINPISFDLNQMRLSNQKNMKRLPGYTHNRNREASLQESMLRSLNRSKQGDPLPRAVGSLFEKDQHMELNPYSSIEHTPQPLSHPKHARHTDNHYPAAIALPRGLTQKNRAL